MPDPLSGPVLVLDSAASACSAAVVAGQNVLASRFKPMSRGHDQALPPMIREVVRSAAVGFPDLAGIGVTVGPGSFTGLRVGLAAARGLALATGLPLAGVTTFEALAASVQSVRPFLVAIDTKRRDLYVQAFAAGRSLSDPKVVAPGCAAALLQSDPLPVIGDGADLIEATGRRVVRLGPSQPDAALFGWFAAARLGRDPGEIAVRPLYLRAPEVSMPGSAAVP